MGRRRRAAKAGAGIAAYLRVSTSEQAASGLGLAAQRAKIEAHAAAGGIEIAEWYVDDGFSGSSLDRPAMARMLADLDRGRIGGVIVAKLDRLTRSVRDLDALVDRFTRGPRLVLVEGQADTATAAGRMILNITASVGQHEREATAERTTVALKAKRARGERAGAVPYGYRLDPADPARQRIVEHPDEQAALRRMVELREQGATTTAIADALTAEMPHAARGARFYQPTVWKLLRDRAA